MEERKVLLTVNENKTLKFFIETSLPATKKLLKNGEEFENALMQTKENDISMSFEVENACLKDTGEYICLVENSLGTVKSSIQLHVHDVSGNYSISIVALVKIKLKS